MKFLVAAFHEHNTSIVLAYQFLLLDYLSWMIQKLLDVVHLLNISIKCNRIIFTLKKFLPLTITGYDSCNTVSFDSAIAHKYSPLALLVTFFKVKYEENENFVILLLIINSAEIYK